MKGIFLEWPSGSYYPNQSVWRVQGADTLSTAESGSLIPDVLSPFLSRPPLSVLNGYLMAQRTAMSSISSV